MGARYVVSLTLRRVKKKQHRDIHREVSLTQASGHLTAPRTNSRPFRY